MVFNLSDVVVRDAIVSICSHAGLRLIIDLIEELLESEEVSVVDKLEYHPPLVIVIDCHCCYPILV